MSRPWMPLYVADYLADTAHLSAAEHGAYLLLIMHYWTKGKLPDDEEAIRRVTRLTARQWAQSRDVLRSLFGADWRHKRIDEELGKAIEKSKVNSANAKRSHDVRTTNAERTHTQSQSPKEDKIVEGRAGGFTEGSKALRSALWLALGISSPLEVPLELAGTDWRAVTWEQAGWTADLIEAEARRIGPGKPLSYYEKCFATAFAKRQAPLPVVKVREAENLTVTHGRIQETQSLSHAARRLAANGVSFGPKPELPTLRSIESGTDVRLLSQSGGERPGDLRGGGIGGLERLPAGGDRLHHGPQDGLAEQVPVAPERVRSS